MLVIGGDAIVDLIAKGGALYEACAGGSTLNCAVTAGRLGASVLYVSTLSQDAYGDLLADRLTASGVQLRPNARTVANSSLAVVSLDPRNQPSYAFYRNGTADRDIPVDAIVASFPDAMRIFHVGSCALIPESDQKAWLRVIEAAKSKGALISIDPNCRPSMTTDPDAYREGMAGLLATADLIKLSDEDLAYLHPEWSEADPGLVMERYAPSLCVLTQGQQGLIGLTRAGIRVEVPATLPDALGDTVGAGDSVHGTLLAELDRRQIGRDGLEEVSESELRDMLSMASQVAGMNCARRGCHPPTRAEWATTYDEAAAASNATTA